MLRKTAKLLSKRPNKKSAPAGSKIPKATYTNPFPPDLSNAIRRTSRSVPSDLISKSGIEKIRVLSEQKFYQLLNDLVNSECEKRERSWSSQIEKDGEFQNNLEKKYQELWHGYKAIQQEKFRKVEARLATLHNTFTKLESSTQSFSTLLFSLSGKTDENPEHDDNSKHNPC